MIEQFIQKNFNAKSKILIDLVINILNEYRDQGYDLTLRQLYYQMVARDHIENKVRVYKNLGNLVSNARLAGLVDWSMIVDRGRVPRTNSHWDDPADIIKQAANQFRIEKWEDQKYHVEVWVEKDALSGVLAPVCEDLDITFMANKGYSSSSAMYRAGKRLARKIEDEKIPVILYLGDLDPSGVDMDRDIEDRLEMFAGEWIEVKRLALDMEQIEKYDPPPDPAKVTDSRYRKYSIIYGDQSWELDALEPSVLDALVRDGVDGFRDPDLWESKVAIEKTMRAELKKMAKEYKKNQKDQSDG